MRLKDERNCFTKHDTEQELFEAKANGTFEEAFGTGTAAVISPMGELNWDGKNISINNGKIGELSQRLYDEITAIQYGRSEDKFGWIVKL